MKSLLNCLFTMLILALCLGLGSWARADDYIGRDHRRLHVYLEPVDGVQCIHFDLFTHSDIIGEPGTLVFTRYFDVQKFSVFEKAVAKASLKKQKWLFISTDFTLGTLWFSGFALQRFVLGPNSLFDMIFAATAAGGLSSMILLQWRVFNKNKVRLRSVVPLGESNQTQLIDSATDLYNGLLSLANRSVCNSEINAL